MAKKIEHVQMIFSCKSCGFEEVKTVFRGTIKTKCSRCGRICDGVVLKSDKPG